jgi:hypothetical protein
MQKHWATKSKESSLDKRILQHMATPGNGARRIVALKVAGSSPVGHPSVCLVCILGKRKLETDCDGNPELAAIFKVCIAIGGCTLAVGSFVAPHWTGI